LKEKKEREWKINLQNMENALQVIGLLAE